MKTNKKISTKILTKMYNTIHKQQIKKGFYDIPKSIEEHKCAIICELSESWEAYRKNKRANLQFYNKSIQYPNSNKIDLFNCLIKGSIEDELADVFIRFMDYCGDKKDEINYETVISLLSMTDTSQVSIYLVSDYISNMINFINTLTYKTKISSYKECFLFKLFTLSDILKFNLMDFVNLKLEYNKMRPYKHGKKF